jgi:hypothetical protein
MKETAKHMLKQSLPLLGLVLVVNAASGRARAAESSQRPPPRINACFTGKLAVILPTGESTREACQRIRAYVEPIWKSRALLLDDTAALKTNLSAYAVVTYGTLQGNLWVKQQLTNWPVVIAGDAITTERRWEGSRLRVIACWRSPANPARSWVLYAAQNEQDVVGINGVFHGPAQFTVAQGTTVLENGYYARRNGTWAASAIPDFDFPALTREQMLQDYDRLASIIHQVFPLTEINKQIYGLDVDQLLADNRKQIDSIRQTTEFADLINRTIVSCRGSHFWIAAPSRSAYHEGFVAEAAYELAESYEQYVEMSGAGNNTELPLLYFNGSYYTAHDFTCGGTTYPKGLKVRACNGQAPDALVQALSRSGVALDWDYDRNKYYTTRFYKYAPAANSNSAVVLELAGTNGASMTLEVSEATRAQWQERPHTSARPQVALVNSNILYIRLPAMDPKQLPFYRKELGKYRGQAIRKAVIDIRNNGGGSDDVWGELLSLLVKEKLVLSYALAAKVSDINTNYLARHGFGKGLAKNGKVEHISFLNNQEFRVLRTSEPIEPHADSLKLGCSIFVLSDHVYSSAGSLMDICKQSRQLVSVGLPNSQILGVGIDPFAFSLPNSKIVFLIEPVVDLTGARTAKDTHHNDVEVRIKPTLGQLLDYYGTDAALPLEERLNKHDPFFQRVLELD